MSTTGSYRKNQLGLPPSDFRIAEIYATSVRMVEKASALLPQTAQTPYFRVTGRVLITQLVGEVTVVLGATATNLSLVANPTVGADVNLCAVVAIASDAVGTLYTITGTLADAMIATTSGAVVAQASSILVANGTIDLKTSANDTGQTKWTLHYIPLDLGSTVVPI
jgi:hypothetical protein